MKRFLVPGAWRVGDRVRLSPEESKHAVRVMRLETGSQVLLSNGEGMEADGKLADTDKAGAQVEILAVRAAPTRAFRVELLQGMLKGARMDWLVEKATELGVDAVRAVDTQFSVAGDRSDRWARVAQAALKQSGNLRMPELAEPAALLEALGALAPGSRGFLLSPSAPEGLAQAIRRTMPKAEGTAVLAIGPEGGFSPDEERLLESKGFLPCRLSSQILRGETAALTAAAVALHALEFGAPAGL